MGAGRPPVDDAREAARKKEQRAAVAAFEKRNDLVPGSAHFGSTRPEGGTSMEGAARMALARSDAGHPLNDNDREALHRHPRPGSCFFPGSPHRQEPDR